MIKNLLAIAIADEQLAELNYLYSYSLEKTEGKADFDPEFEQHEEEERQHKYDLINRLRELDAKVIFVPIEQMIYFNSIGVEWKQEFSEISRDVILRRLEEEEHAVNFYGLATEFVRGTSDTTTYTLFKKIKEDEEKHVKDLRDLARDHGFLEL
jgi:bacterioferritin (cytochrome b1)